MNEFNLLLQRIDVFGYQPAFRIYGQRKLRSEFGGFLTLLIIIFSLMVIFSEASDFFFHNRPTILNYTKTNYNPLQFNFPNNTYVPFQLNMFDSQNNMISTNNLFFQLEVIQTGSSQIFKTQPCSNYQSYFNSIGNLNFVQQNFQCIDLSGISIGGQNDQVTFTANYCIDQLKCDIKNQKQLFLYNYTDNSNLYQKPFNYYINLITYLPMYTIDPTQNTPFSYDFMYNYDSNYAQSMLKKQILFKKMNLMINDGYLVNNNQTTTTFGVDSLINTVDQRMAFSQNTIATFSFKSSNKIDICNISHMKLYEAIFYSYVYIQIIYLFMSLFMFFANRFIFKKVVLECFFETVDKINMRIDETNHNQDILKRLKKKICNRGVKILDDYSDDVKSDKNALVLNEENQIICLNQVNRAQTYLVKENKNNNNQNLNIESGVVEINNKNHLEVDNNVVIHTSVNDPKLNSNAYKPIIDIKKSINEFVRRKLDFADIIKLRQEFETLKKIILNEKQLESFNYFEKRKAFIENEKIVDIEQELDNSCNEHEIVNYYVNRINRNSITEIDKRILLMLKSQIYKMIEEKI